MALIRIRKKKSKNKKRFIDEKIVDSLNLRKIKMVVEFNNRESASIKSFAVKNRNEIKLTTRFMLGKLLMFAKRYLKSFIYDLLETFCFPQKKIVALNKKYLMEKVQFFHILTDTDSTVLKFISHPNSDLPDDKFKDITFEVIVTSKIYRRFHTSHDSYT